MELNIWEQRRLEDIRNNCKTHYSSHVDGVGTISRSDYAVHDVKWLLDKFDLLQHQIELRDDAAMEIHGTYMQDELIADSQAAFEALRHSAETHRIAFGVEAVYINEIDEGYVPLPSEDNTKPLSMPDMDLPPTA